MTRSVRSAADVGIGPEEAEICDELVALISSSAGTPDDLLSLALSMPTSIGKRFTANCCASTLVVVRPRAKFSATIRVTELSVCVTPSRTQPWSAQSTASARRVMCGCAVRSIMQSFVTCCSSTPRLSIGFPRLSQCCCARER